MMYWKRAAIGEALPDGMRIVPRGHLLSWTENKSPLKTVFFPPFYLANNTAAAGCSCSDTSTARYHTATQRCAFHTSPNACFVTVRSHSGTSQHSTTLSPRKPPAIAHALVWQCLAFSYISKCAWSFEFCAGLSLRYNVQTCPEATATKTNKQTNKNPITTLVTLSSQRYSVERSEC